MATPTSPSSKAASTKAALIDDLDFERLLPDAPFSERHSITIDRPIAEVWPAVRDLTGDEIKLLRPLFQLRGIPARLQGKEGPEPVGDSAVLELFEEEGFTMLRHDEGPVDGRAILMFGAVGKFWSLAHNAPVPFDSPKDFLAFSEPGYAKTVARFEAWEEDGVTKVETETLVVGTDPSSTKKFGAYWLIIRGPSGLLRRSWLSAIERRATA